MTALPAALALVAWLLAASPEFARAQGIPLGAPLPALRGDLLSGGKIVLPDSAHGTPLLLLLGFTYESRHDVEVWGQRFRADLGPDSSLACYEVPMIGGAGRLARPFIDRGMRRGTPRQLHRRVITVYGGTGEWKRRVEFSEPDVAYLLLVDAQGRLMWRARGPFSDEGYRALAERVRDVLEEWQAEL